MHGITISVNAGEVVALLGPNGVGKSTTIMSIAGVLTPTSGTISLDGHMLRSATNRRARQGLAVVPEGRLVFVGLSTATNLATRLIVDLGNCSLNWWLPGWLDRNVPHLDLEGASGASGALGVPERGAPEPQRERELTAV